MNQIKIYLRSVSKPDKHPTVHITSDSLSLNDVITVEDSLCYSIDCTVGLHDLTIHFNNKEANDTVIVNGEIAEDLAVIIDDFKIDGISVKDHINEFSHYTDWEGNSIQTYGWLSFPTPMTLTLQVPGLLFKRNIVLLNLNNENFKEVYK